MIKEKKEGNIFPYNIENNSFMLKS